MRKTEMAMGQLSEESVIRMENGRSVTRMENESKIELPLIENKEHEK